MMKSNFKKLGNFLLIIAISFIAIFFDIKPAIAGTVLVTNVLSNSVTLYDEATLLTIKEIKVGFMPHEVVVSPNGKTAIVSDFGDLLNIHPGNTLSIISIPDASLSRTIQLPAKSRPHGIEILSDSLALVTAQGIQSLLVVNYLDGTITRTIPLPSAGAHMVITDAEKRYAYVANVDSGTITKINLQDYTVVGEIKIGHEAEGLALTPGEDLLLTTNRVDNVVAVVRTKDLSIIKKIPTESGPVRVLTFDNGKSALVTNTVAGTVQVIDLASLMITNTFKTSSSHSLLPVPINVFVNSDQKTAYITNSFADTVILMDLTNGSILKTFSAGYMPDGVSISPIDAVSADNSSGAMFNSGPIDINANIENVWKIAKKVEDYYRLSQGAITAQVDAIFNRAK